MSAGVREVEVFSPVREDYLPDGIAGLDADGHHAAG